MDTCINGQWSKGPYGYLCLGLLYGWNDEKKILALERLILVKLDLKLRACIELPVYYDQLQYENIITERDGRYYYQDCPILNYDMLEIPDKLDGVVEEEVLFGEKRSRFVNPNGRTKYSVNRVCTVGSEFFGCYKELYACVTDFDRETLQGSLVGFDCLGKILIKRDFALKGLNRIRDIRRTLLKNMVLFDWKYDEEDEIRKEECGIMNLDYSSDSNGGIIFEYNSVWD